MTAKQLSENPVIAMKSNWLTVDSQILRADVLEDARSNRLSVSAEELERVLILGRRSMLQAVEAMHAETKAKNPGSAVVRPSVFTAQLGTTKQTDGKDSQVFTTKGYDNGGVLTLPDEIRPEFHGHWNAVKEAGLLPEVHNISGKRDGGAWLLVRKPSLDDVLHHWFDYPSDYTDMTSRWLKDDDEEKQRSNVGNFRMIGEWTADQRDDLQRPRAQLGLMIAMSAIKLSLHDQPGFEEEIDDAFVYADHSPSIDASTVRAMENATFGL